MSIHHHSFQVPQFIAAHHLWSMLIGVTLAIVVLLLVALVAMSIGWQGDINLNPIGNQILGDPAWLV